MSDTPSDPHAKAEGVPASVNGESKDLNGEVEKPVEPVITVEDEIFNNITLIGKAVTSIESRFISRVLRTLTGLRKKMTKSAIKIALDQAFPKGSKTGQALIASDIFQSLPDSTASTSALDMEVDSAQPAATSPTPSIKKFNPPVDPSTQDLLPECIIYLRLLLILANLDAGRIHEAGEFAMETAEMVTTYGRRTMDQLAAKIYFYLARAYELEGRLSELQLILLAARQTARLRSDDTLEVMTTNLLLRSYLAQHQYDQADKLMAKSELGSSVNQGQIVRYQFYAGRLRAVQLNYSDARFYLQAAIRRAPRDECAPGFVQIIHKYFIIVVLLTGVIPDRAMFRRPVLRQALIPYFQIVQGEYTPAPAPVSILDIPRLAYVASAVRVGDVPAFEKAFSTHEATFHVDSTHFLILRLRHFVIKAALRTITLAYSRISLADVCFKLHLDSEEDTEYIVAKAIKDGVIDATIDHAGGYMQSRVSKDVYETDEPQKQFNQRVSHCTTMYNETVRAMRYPPGAHRKELESAADARERDREIAQLIQDNDADDDMDDL